ncbi:hypothetical protein HDV03_000564 [Kappamyces sp. JEL0829]|nr:hypothetical protein HDV03_000564 [Kappamyces sp. JEL0829]
MSGETVAAKPKNKKNHKLAFKSSSKTRSILLREIKALGGDATDLDLLSAVLSGSEAEGASEVVQKTNLKVDEKLLEKDLKNFLQGLGIKPPQDVDTDEESEPEPEVEKKPTKNELKKLKKQQVQELEKEGKLKPAPALDLGKITEEFLAGDGDLDDDTDMLPVAGALGKGSEGNVRDMVSQMLSGVNPAETIRDELYFKQNAQYWYQHNLPEISSATVSVQDAGKVKAVFQKAEQLWKTDKATYEKVRATNSKANKDFVATILKSGTVTDKVSALTLMIQESPVHAFSHFSQHLLGMAGKKARREALLAIDSMKDLLLTNLLPDRPLKYFVDQPCLSKNATPAHLIVWYFEDALKKAYFEFIRTIEELSKDVLLHVKSKMVTCVFELLSEKPEQEENLLVLLVNKVGDLEKKVASRATFHLSQLLVKHPLMKSIVIAEVERLLMRPNVADRARYYAITFLNQIVLTQSPEDVKTANTLIHLYFTLFNSLVKTMKTREHEKETPKKKKDRKRDRKGKGHHHATAEETPLLEVDSLNSKMMAALLTGVNRAFPFSNLESEVFDSHIDMLFTITHLATFNTAIQALTLIFQVQNSREALSDRFYRGLYDTLQDARLHDASKQAMYLNLLYRALKIDASIDRVKAFVKRLIQSLSLSQVPLICAGLFLVGELGNHRPGIFGMVTQPEEHDDASETAKYDGRKRDPQYANAQNSCLWELSMFANHFHPTVALYAQTILSGKAVEVPPGATNYDPLLNHTLTRFLERFVYKAPKKVKSLYHGSSLMQPRTQRSLLLTGGRKKPNAIYEDEDGGDTKFMDDAPVNAAKWKSESQVPADEVFFYRYFKDHKKATENSTAVLSDLDSQNSDLDEDEIWSAMRRSTGFDKAGLGPDVDDATAFQSDDELNMEDTIDYNQDSQDEDFQATELDMDDWVNDADADNDNDNDGSQADEPEGSDEDGADDDLDAFANEDEALASLFKDEFSDEEDTKKPKKKPKQLEKFSSIASKLGYKGDFFDMKSGASEFASADDFAALLGIDEQEEPLDNVPRPKKRKAAAPPKAKSKKQK